MGIRFCVRDVARVIRQARSGWKSPGTSQVLGKEGMLKQGVSEYRAIKRKQQS